MTKERLGVLDGIRACSILLVLGSHMLPLGPRVLQMNAWAGAAGMSLFFCLSGFFITETLHRDPTWRSFMIRRLMRIMPPLLMYVAVTALFLSHNIQGALAAVFGFLNYRDDLHFLPYSGHLWSICVELQFYMAIGVVVALLGRRGLWLILPAAIVVTSLRIDQGAHISIRTHLRVDEILSGGLLALIWLHRDHPLGRRLAALMTFGLPLTGVLWFLSCHPAGDAFMYARPYLAAALVGAAMFAQPNRVTRLLETRPMAYIARISYSLYIWHMLMIAGWFSAGSKWFMYLVKRPISFALTFLAADLSTRTVEAWCIARARSWCRSSGSSAGPRPTAVR